MVLRVKPGQQVGCMAGNLELPFTRSTHCPARAAQQASTHTGTNHRHPLTPDLEVKAVGHQVTQRAVDQAQPRAATAPASLASGLCPQQRLRIIALPWSGAQPRCRRHHAAGGGCQGRHVEHRKGQGRKLQPLAAAGAALPLGGVAAGLGCLHQRSHIQGQEAGGGGGGQPQPLVGTVAAQQHLQAVGGWGVEGRSDGRQRWRAGRRCSLRANGAQRMPRKPNPAAPRGNAYQQDGGEEAAEAVWQAMCRLKPSCQHRAQQQMAEVAH